MFTVISVPLPSVSVCCQDMWVALVKSLRRENVSLNRYFFRIRIATCSVAARVKCQHHVVFVFGFCGWSCGWRRFALLRGLNDVSGVA